jgi:hypothetical protein
LREGKSEGYIFWGDLLEDGNSSVEQNDKTLFFARAFFEGRTLVHLPEILLGERNGMPGFGAASGEVFWDRGERGEDGEGSVGAV